MDPCRHGPGLRRPLEQQLPDDLDQRPGVVSAAALYRLGVGLRRLRPMGMAVVGALLLTLAGGGVASSQLESPARAPAYTPKGLGTLPASAYPAVSATLGAGSPAYAARRSPSGFRLTGGGVAAQFGASGVSLQAGGVSLVMEAATYWPRRPAPTGGRALGGREAETVSRSSATGWRSGTRRDRSGSSRASRSPAAPQARRPRSRSRCDSVATCVRIRIRGLCC